ncbi:DUF349 domain-containing protein [Corallincola holothuriorum]|uniref:DUF349 domain-containing protein n=1 Tax=Corallincola holothuriorum TaxID=2282215 RepID=A0A368NKX0_9GAMM|nr:DUF349 domain-containing protein [Corallincola holothuriorum]RCU50415.1 DUF349 domain-containing protein [Corallincola holothuriorum]
MIFKNLFRPAWQHKDPAKRQSAIAELDSSNQPHRTILRELAFNDGHRQVRRLALEKLNELSLWWLAAGEERDDGLKKAALQHVTDIITAASPLDTAQVSAFVSDCKDRKYLEAVWRQLPADSLRQSALERINKARCYIDAADSDPSTEIALWAAAKIDDEKQMRRLAKKAGNIEVQAFFVSKLEALQRAKERPAELNEQARLLLAQLQGVTEKLTEPQAVEQRSLGDKANELEIRWQSLAKELEPLELLAPWQAKHEGIAKRLYARLEELMAIWQQAEAQEKAANEKLENAAMLRGGFEALQVDIKAIHKLIEQQQAFDIKPLTEVLSALKQQLGAEALNESDWMALSKLAADVTEQLVKLEDLPAQLAKAEALVAPLQQIDADSETFLTDLAEWRGQWRAVSDLPLPDGLRAQVNELTTPLEKAKKALFRMRKEAEETVDKLLGKAERHQQAGRLKVAVREFHRLAKPYALLSDKAKRRFDKRYQKLAAVEQELLEWHQLVAAPKADALLEEIKALAESPAEDPKVQADAVKDARRRWQLLEVDRNEASWTPLAEQFDTLSEKAFEICRQFYGEQQQEREKHLQEREEVIKAVQALYEQHKEAPLALNDLESKYRQLSNKWRQCGEIDFAKRKAVQNRFVKASRKVTDVLKQLYSVNEAQKQQLLKQAEALDLSDATGSSEQFDGLMKKWRDAGYAGANEKSLWQRFQYVGQQLREQRNASRTEQREQWQSNADAYKVVLSEFAAAIAAAEDDAALRQSIAQAQQAADAIGETAHRDRRELEAEMDDLRRQAMEAIAARQKQQEQRNYQVLIEAVTANSDELLQSLPERWQKTVKQWQEKGAEKPADAEIRERLTIEAELLAGLDSPNNSDALRQQLRLTLLQARMNGSGDSERSVENLFWQWLEAGAVTKADEDALKRFERALTA